MKTRDQNKNGNLKMEGHLKLHHIKYSKKNLMVHIQGDKLGRRFSSCCMMDQPVRNVNEYHKENYKIKAGVRQECVSVSQTSRSVGS